MRTVGIVCEYNPLHLGHARQLTHLRMQHPEAAVVCLMSGLYVQRGQPAVFSRQVRANSISCSEQRRRPGQIRRASFREFRMAR